MLRGPVCGTPSCGAAWVVTDAALPVTTVLCLCPCVNCGVALVLVSFSCGRNARREGVLVLNARKHDRKQYLNVSAESECRPPNRIKVI